METQPCSADPLGSRAGRDLGTGQNELTIWPAVFATEIDGVRGSDSRARLTHNWQWRPRPPGDHTGDHTRDDRTPVQVSSVQASKLQSPVSMTSLRGQSSLQGAVVAA